MIATRQFAATLAAATVSSGVAAVAFVDESAMGTAVLCAATLSSFNALCALGLAEIGATRKSTKAFFGAVFGGMLARMATTLAGLFVAVRIFHLPIAPFTVTLLGCTAVFTAVETAIWSRQNFSSQVQGS